jgi:hypothetical protein
MSVILVAMFALSGCAKAATPLPGYGIDTNPEPAAEVKAAAPAAEDHPAATAMSVAEETNQVDKEEIFYGGQPTATVKPKAAPTVRIPREGYVQLAFSEEAMKASETIAEAYNPIDKEEIFFGGQGGGGGIRCSIPEYQQPPLICYDSYIGWIDSVEIFLVGFPGNSNASLTLVDPAGNQVGSTQSLRQLNDRSLFILQEDNGDSRGYDDTNILAAPLWMPVGTPTGDWKIIANAGNITKEMVLHYPPKDKSGTLPRINVLPDLEISPFIRSIFKEDTALKPGDLLWIGGQNLGPNEQFSIGVFYMGDIGTQISAKKTADMGIRVTTSSSGDFLAKIQIPASAWDGPYCIFPSLAYFHSSTGGIMPRSSWCYEVNSGNGKPTPLPGTFTCSGAPETRLEVGDTASVSLVPPDPNIVREGPGKDEDKIGKIQPGERVTILEGPECADHLVWWKVKSLKTGLTGWTAEGDMKNYWLVPED